MKSASAITMEDAKTHVMVTCFTAIVLSYIAVNSVNDLKVRGLMRIVGIV